MSWTTVIWSALAGVCMAVAGFQFPLWVQSRKSWANLLFGIAAFSGAFMAVCEANLMFNRGVLPLPLTMSLLFPIIIAGIAFEMGNDVVRTARLSRELHESQQRMHLATTAADLGVWEWDISIRDGNPVWAGGNGRG